MPKGIQWSTEDSEKLITLWNELTPTIEISNALNRTPESIKTEVMRLRRKNNFLRTDRRDKVYYKSQDSKQNRWTEEEDKILLNLWNEKQLYKKEIASQMNKTLSAIENRGNILRKRNIYLKSANYKRMGEYLSNKNWTKEKINEYISMWNNDININKISSYFNVSRYSIYQWNKKLRKKGYDLKHRCPKKDPTTLKGYYIDKTGYKFISLSSLPPEDQLLVGKMLSEGNRNNNRIQEHRLIMAKKLGRPLKLHPKEIVHHLNGIRTDNCPENLTLVTPKTHKTRTFIKSLQQRIRELEKTKDF